MSPHQFRLGHPNPKHHDNRGSSRYDTQREAREPIRLRFPVGETQASFGLGHPKVKLPYGWGAWIGRKPCGLRKLPRMARQGAPQSG